MPQSTSSTNKSSSSSSSSTCGDIIGIKKYRTEDNEPILMKKQKTTMMKLEKLQVASLLDKASDPSVVTSTKDVLMMKSTKDFVTKKLKTEPDYSRDGSTTSSNQVPEMNQLDEQCKRLADIIRRSKHLVVFTGAGISTSVGIPDYRGENGIRTKNSIVNKKKRSKARALRNSISPSNENSEIIIPDFNKLVPSKTHMALYELYRLGYLKHLVSQNVDNLHLKSDIPAKILTEVHGNATHAKCETCEKVYTKDFPWSGLCEDPSCESTKKSIEQRLNSRTRHGNGRLKRHVISFDEPMGDIDHAIDECEVCDVSLVLGTSLKVEPFSEMAGEYADSVNIINLQPTLPRLDRRAETTGVRIYEKCDLVMEKVMKYLMKDQAYEIPPWKGEHPTNVFVPEHEDKNLVNVLAGRITRNS